MTTLQEINDANIYIRFYSKNNCHIYFDAGEVGSIINDGGTFNWAEQWIINIDTSTIKVTRGSRWPNDNGNTYSWQNIYIDDDSMKENFTIQSLLRDRPDLMKRMLVAIEKNDNKKREFIKNIFKYDGK